MILAEAMHVIAKGPVYQLLRRVSPPNIHSEEKVRPDFQMPFSS